MNENVRIYAGTQHGLMVWRSKNDLWEEVAQSFRDGIIDSIIGCRGRPERVFVGVTHDGLYRTDDGGKTWGKVLNGDIRAVTLDSTAEDVVYAGVEPVGVYRSEDGGNTWEELNSLQELSEEVRRKWWHPVAPHHGHVRNMFIHPDDTERVYLCIEHGGIVRSLDRGETWEDVTEGIEYVDIHVLCSLPRRFDRYFVTSARGFFASNDPAQGWERAENGLTRDYFHDFLFLPPCNGSEEPTMLLATADKSPGYWAREGRHGARAALFRSHDCANSWYRVTHGLPEDLDPMFWALAHHPHDPNAVFAGLGDVARGPAAGAGGAGKILVSRDIGESWEDLDIQLPADRVLWAAAD